MTLTTIKNYCSQRGVSKQFVYEYIKKGKFQMLELPYFVELDGEKFEVGTQKFLKVPDYLTVEKKPYWSGELETNEYNKQLAADATKDNELQAYLIKYLETPSEEEETFKKSMIDFFSNSKSKELDAALRKLSLLLKAELADLHSRVTTKS